MPILLGFAFVAGVLTILTPCVLPMVPLVLGTSAAGGRARPLGVVAGLAISFTLFAVVLAAALAALGLTTDKLRLLSVLALAVFGLALLVPAFGARVEAAFAPLARLGARATGNGTRGGGLAGGFLIGAGLGLIWAPCAGPIMATVIALATTQGATLATAVVALAYAAGAGVPLLALGYGGRALARRSRRLAGGGVQRAFGALMLLTCVAILFNLDTRAQVALAGVLPAGWTTALYSVEQGPVVQRELQGLQGAPPAKVLPVAAAPAAAPATVPPRPAPPTLAPTAPVLTAPASTVPPASAPAAPTRPAAAPAAKPAGPTLPPPIDADLSGPVKLDDLGPAPEITGITAWINSPPLTMRALRGKVVLVHFWTFACINCIHVQPYVKAWYARYKDAGFTVLGIHTPELSFEHDLTNVRQAVADEGVRFPVAFDPNYVPWHAYHNGYWPAFYFVDKLGQIRHTHVGEGDYAGSEQVIRELLAGE